MAPRSRTGCLTCRSRKLKCDEGRPTCGNCVKANRNCVPSQGITFRHQQNPSLNGKEQDGLKSFYGYKETFAKSTTWVRVPRDLTFVHTNNPYEDDDGEGDDGGVLPAPARLFPGPPVHPYSMGHEFGVSPASYPAFASHGLEALSAVANYASQPPATSGHQRSPAQMSAQPVTTNGLGLDFILNPASQNVSPVAGSNIDPQLQARTPTGPLRSPTHGLQDVEEQLRSRIQS